MLRTYYKRVAGSSTPARCFVFRQTRLSVQPVLLPKAEVFSSETQSSHTLEAHRDTLCFFVSPSRFIARRVRVDGSTTGDLRPPGCPGETEFHAVGATIMSPAGTGYVEHYKIGCGCPATPFCCRFDTGKSPAAYNPRGPCFLPVK